MSGFHLLKSFLKSPTATGSVWPSSEYLADEITSCIGLENASFIAELGPGTGALTEYILKKKKDNASLLAIELNSDLYNVLKEKYPSVKIINEDASKLSTIIAKENIPSLDIVVSGLPWASFPLSLQKSIMKSVHSSLREGGTFTTFAYVQAMMFPSALRYNRLLKKMFSKVEISRTVWKNIPPAFVYRCHK